MSGRNRLCLLVTKVKSLSILKTVHLLSGAAALLLSIVPSLRADALPWLQQPDSLYLAFTGLANLLVAPLVGVSRQRLQGTASTLLVLAVVLQSLALMVPLHSIGGQPAELFTLLAVALAALMQLLPQPSAAAATEQATQPAESPRPAKTASPSAKAPATKSTPTRRGEPDSERETGTVKWFNTSKGFGFISRDRGEDIFVHFRAIRGEGHRVLVEGQRVEFSVVQRDKGLQAEDVMIID